MKAYSYKSGKREEVEIFADKRARIDALREKILEAVAETSEEMLEKYFGGEEITQEEINQGLAVGVKNGDLVPVILGSADKNIGVGTLLNMLLEFLPKPEELKPLKGINPRTEEKVERKLYHLNHLVVMSLRQLLTHLLVRLT